MLLWPLLGMVTGGCDNDSAEMRCAGRWEEACQDDAGGARELSGRAVKNIGGYTNRSWCAAVSGCYTKGLALVQILVVASRRGMQAGQQLCIQQQFWLTAAGR